MTYLRLITLNCLFFLLIPQIYAQTPFTAADALEVVSLSGITISPDGKYVAAIRNKSGRNRLDVDHFRFRDISYIRPYKGGLVVYETEQNQNPNIIEENAHIIRPTWSPDGKILAFFKVENEEVKLYTHIVKSGKSKEIVHKMNKPISTNSPIIWLPDGKSLILALRETDWKQKGKEMFEEATKGPVVVYDAEEPFLKWDAIGNHSQMQSIAEVQISNGEVLELLPEGRYSSLRMEAEGAFLIYTETYPVKTSYNRKDGIEYEIKRLDISDDEDPVVIKEKSFERPNVSFNKHNDWLAWAKDGDIYVQHAKGDSATNLTDGENYLQDEDSTEVKFSVEIWAPDATQLIARSKQGLWLIQRENKEVRLFHKFDEEDKKAPRLNAQAWSEDGRYIYFRYAARDKWERGMLRYDFEQNQMQDLIKDDRIYNQWQLSKDGSTFIYQSSAGDLPNELFAVDRDFNTPRQLSNLNPWLRDKKMTKSELISYLDTDGKESYGILYYPVDYEEGKKYPLVCEIYERFFDNGYRSSMNIIANAGYFGFRPSVNFEEGYPGEAWIKGVTAGINKLIERGLIDPEKIGVHGTSYGGYATSLLIAQTDRFAAAINISGKTNIISFLGDSPRIGTRNYAAAEVGQDRIGDNLWNAPMKYLNTSAILLADRINTPHLLLTGEGDWNVPAANTRELYYALRRLGKKAVWVNYMNAGHGAGWAGSESDYLDQWKRMLEWYETHFEEKEEEVEAAQR